MIVHRVLHSWGSVIKMAITGYSSDKGYPRFLSLDVIFLISWIWTIISLSSSITYLHNQAANPATATKPLPSNQARNVAHSPEAISLSSNRLATECSKVMKTCILATQFPLSHAAILSAFDVVDASPDSGLATVDDTLGMGRVFRMSMNSMTSRCSRAIRV